MTHSLTVSACLCCAASCAGWWAQAECGKGPLQQKPYAVFGLGSSSYPRFCAAADLMDSMLIGDGATRMAAVEKGTHSPCSQAEACLLFLLLPLFLACYMTCLPTSSCSLASWLAT